jgi:trehalose-phosphatase
MGQRHHQKTLQTRMTAPRHALDAWKTIIQEVRRARHLALFTDFDGTLVRIRKDPHPVALPAPDRQLLGAIAHSGVLVGVVSGRRVADVRKRVGLGDIWYVGSHGFVLAGPRQRSIVLVNPKERSRMARIRHALARRLRGVPGIRLEPKESTVAVHYRGAPRPSKHLARRAVCELMERHPELSLLSGKKVWELLPHSRTNKWTAICQILRRECKRASGGRWLVIFLGDDATDERAFQEMQGISIVVGRKSRTAARYYLCSPVEVRRFLEKLKRELEQPQEESTLSGQRHAALLRQ